MTYTIKLGLTSSVKELVVSLKSDERENGRGDWEEMILREWTEFHG